MRRRLDGKRVLILPALLAAIGLFTFLSSPQVHASPGLYYHRGYSIQGTWLCYGWSNGSYYCTQRWRVSNGRYLSYNPRVPSQGVSLAYYAPVVSRAAPPAPVSPISPVAALRYEPCQSTDFWASTISQWTVPPSCFGNIYYPNPRNYVSRPSYGWCNWWPEVMTPQYGGYSALYRPNHSWPVPGATVFFSGGVQGASLEGHYAIVIAVNPNHYWVLVSEMNFYWRGGGWQKVDYRYIHVGPGVTFRF